MEQVDAAGFYPATILFPIRGRLISFLPDYPDMLVRKAAQSLVSSSSSKWPALVACGTQLQHAVQNMYGADPNASTRRNLYRRNLYGIRKSQDGTMSSKT